MVEGGLRWACFERKTKTANSRILKGNTYWSCGLVNPQSSCRLVRATSHHDIDRTMMHPAEGQAAGRAAGGMWSRLKRGEKADGMINALGLMVIGLDVERKELH